MYHLLEYIRSSFNSIYDIDTQNPAVNPKLQLLDKTSYKVFVTDVCIPGCEQLTEPYTKLVQRAFDEWSLAIRNKIKFRVVTSLQGADIKLYWIKSKRTYAARQNWDANIIAPMPVLNIGIMDTAEVLYTKSQVYHLLLHEIGHIFKLGHSPIVEDVMSCSPVWSPVLSGNDVFVLNLIYSLGNGISFLDAYFEIEKRVKTHLNNIKSARKPLIISPICKVARNTNPKNLLTALEEIQDLNRYNLALQDVGLNVSVRQRFLKPQY